MRILVFLLILVVSGCNSYESQRGAVEDWRRVEESREWVQRRQELLERDPAEYLRRYGDSEPVRYDTGGLDQILLREEIRRQGEDQTWQLRRLEGEIQEMRREQEFRELVR